MEFSTLTARDLPAPATLAEDAATFAVPVYGLMAQPRLRYADHGATQGNGTTYSVAISYSYLAEPGDPDAVVNLVGNIDEVRGWMRKAELDQQPDWFKEGVAAARYPMLWEAVLTAIDPNGDRSLDEHLADMSTTSWSTRCSIAEPSTRSTGWSSTTGSAPRTHNPRPSPSREPACRGRDRHRSRHHRVGGTN